MKNIIKIIFIILLFLGTTFEFYAQTHEWQKPPRPNEIVLEKMNNTVGAPWTCECRYCYDKWKNWTGPNWTVYGEVGGNYQDIEKLYESMEYEIYRKYGTKPNGIINVRNFNCKLITKDPEYRDDNWRTTKREYQCSCTITQKDLNVVAMEQALNNIRDGSRFAIDNVSVVGDINKDDYTDKIVDILLDNGYKVVAKEYLEKLYEEQQSQQSGIYNDKTTVRENNFSAIGYFINVKASKNYVRVQIVNVSTGEFDGYAVACLPNPNNKVVSDDNISQVAQKALRNVPQGSRLAIDNVTISGNDKDYYTDKFISTMIAKGYKLVAKEYLEKLYDEQKQQQSGIYNDRTLVQENNFSAVGYFVNIKVTESSVRLQVINVSTGEFEGNATITF